MEVEPRMKPSIEKAMKILQQKSKTSEVFPIDSVLIAMGTDVTSEYIFGKSLGFLDASGCSNTLRDVLHSMSHYGPFMTFIPFGDKLRYLIPTALLARLFSDIQMVLKNERLIRNICAQGMQSRSTFKSTLFGSLNDPTLPPSERTLDRVTTESILFLLGGTETTGWAIAVTMFHLLNDRSMFMRLREEIKQVLVHPSDYPSWTALETLPYLVSRTPPEGGTRLSAKHVNAVNIARGG